MRNSSPHSERVNCRAHRCAQLRAAVEPRVRVHAGVLLVQRVAKRFVLALAPSPRFLHTPVDCALRVGEGVRRREHATLALERAPQARHDVGRVAERAVALPDAAFDRYVDARRLGVGRAQHRRAPVAVAALDPVRHIVRRRRFGGGGVIGRQRKMAILGAAQRLGGRDPLF